MLQKVVGLAVLTFHHEYGLLVSCITSVVGLNTCVILPTWDVRSVLRAVPRYVEVAFYVCPVLRTINQVQD